MTVREKLDEVLNHLLTLQEDESVRRCKVLIREVIEAKFGGQTNGGEDEHI
jgi:hypothetical protein